MGGLAGINAARVLKGEPPVTPPPTTAHGCLISHVASADPRRFQPMNTNFGLFPPLPSPTRDKEHKRRLIGQRALEDFESWMTRSGLS
jgi:methylenetetrahydrofolate--tRNA-(uracil-5-)-methyltransferase